jgi:hypothetical protein
MAEGRTAPSWRKSDQLVVINNLRRLFVGAIHVRQWRSRWAKPFLKGRVSPLRCVLCNREPLTASCPNFSLLTMNYPCLAKGRARKASVADIKRIDIIIAQ